MAAGVGRGVVEEDLFAPHYSTDAFRSFGDDQCAGGRVVGNPRAGVH